MPTVDWIAVTTCPGTAENRTTIMLWFRLGKRQLRAMGAVRARAPYIHRLPCRIMRATQA